MKDLICLVADKNMEAVMDALLRRHEALGIRPIQFEVVVHPRRDPGVFHEGVAFLRPLQPKFAHGLLLLDAAWDGAPSNLQRRMDDALETVRPRSWAKAVIVDPELEVWVWSDSPQVERALGWSGRVPGLRGWLEQNGLWQAGNPKPLDPKQAMERALWEARKPRSSAIYRSLAHTVSLDRCRDRAFLRLRSILKNWFGKAA